MTIRRDWGLKRFWNWLQKKLEKLKKLAIKPRGRKALDDLLQRSSPGHSHRVREVSGTRADAEAEFRRIAAPGTIAPHPNPKLAASGGLEGRVPGGGRIYFRPYSTSGPTTLDIHEVPGYEPIKEIKLT
ncbi:hypothetical protein HYR99_07675 [Candidatus Poribacteria bacterium]|nr:hypothetical protein [Candidatus Poribacteria bacterium]